MASGYGLHGEVGRCFPFFIDLCECMLKADAPEQCDDYREDYKECLWHKKQLARKYLVDKEIRRRKKLGLPIPSGDEDDNEQQQ
jgi:NADH dehydrogenase (ubiquinone) Fe-S protein 5